MPSGRIDVAIVGAGMVGLTLGALLAGAGLRVKIVDRQSPGASVAESFDGRVSALAAGSQRIFASAGFWKDLAPHAQPILDISVSDADSPLFLHYDSCSAGQGPLGYIVENRHIRAVLFRHAESAGAHVVAPARVVGIDRSRRGAGLMLADGSRLEATLLVSAEGRNASLRREAGIRTSEWAYKQTAIVCTVAHERPHLGVAHERFLPAGPFAILPMRDDDTGAHRSSIVWTERADLAPRLMALDRTDFEAELVSRFGDFLGALETSGPRWSYPLAGLHSERYVDERLALVGDAAHVIHPIAGQGFNLGIRDAAVLAEILVDASRLGLDFGSSVVLDRYQRWRRVDNVGLTLVTDSLNRLFSNEIGPLKLARTLGLGAVQRIPPLKNFLMRHAMGLVGELPRLARGEPL